MKWYLRFLPRYRGYVYVVDNVNDPKQMEPLKWTMDQ